jgi:aerobic-type carbon monoxide dehydrogenase small subunit (CoxS/CutS family)
MQQGFIDHDTFRCGFCTPGQDRVRIDRLLEER